MSAAAQSEQLLERIIIIIIIGIILSRIETSSQKIVFAFSEDTMEEGEPSAKRKKKLNGREIIAKLDSNEKDVKKAVAEIIDDALQIEDRVIVIIVIIISFSRIVSLFNTSNN